MQVADTGRHQLAYTKTQLERQGSRKPGRLRFRPMFPRCLLTLVAPKLGCLPCLEPPSLQPPFHPHHSHLQYKPPENDLSAERFKVDLVIAPSLNCDLLKTNGGFGHLRVETCATFRFAHAHMSESFVSSCFPHPHIFFEHF
jgi:hypothetical protein